MLRASCQLCPFCEARSVWNAVRSPSWQQSRSMAGGPKQKLRRKPARMALSPTVAAPPLRKRPSEIHEMRQAGGPFGGLNRTEAPAGLREAREKRRGGLTKREIYKKEKKPLLRTAPRPPRPEAPKKKSGIDELEEYAREQNKPKKPVAASKRPALMKDRAKKPDSGPFKALKMHRRLENVSYERRAEIKQSIADLDSFEQFPLLPIMQEAIRKDALAGMQDISPTPIQRVAIPKLLGSNKSKRKQDFAGKKEPMEKFLLAAETGSGKTLAYLIPAIDAFKRAELQEKTEEETKMAEEEAAREEKKRRSMFELDSPPLSESLAAREAARPKVIVLVPTAELVSQVSAVAKSLSHIVKFRSAALSASLSPTVIRNNLFNARGIDVLISTPHLLSSIAESDPNILSKVTHLIIDEADSMLDRSFSPLTQNIIDRSTPSLKQLVLCSATIPRSLDYQLQKRFPEINRLVTPNLHAIPRRVQLGVVDVEKEPYKGNKSLACADTIWTIGKSAQEHVEGEPAESIPIKRIIVFINEREQAVEVAQYLESKGIDAYALNRDTETARKEKILASFKDVSIEPPTISGRSATTEGSAPGSKGKELAPSKRHLPNTRVIVTTDLGSRGIDTVAVRHVILYDVPHTSIDFIHRLGRTGRMGRRGRGIVLVGKHDRKDVVREVREAMFMGRSLI